MKFFKLLVAILLFTVIGSFDASAQGFITRSVKDSVAAETKYIYFNNIKKGTTGIQFTALKKSGTVAATVVLERRIDTMPTLATAPWFAVDTVTRSVTNVSTVQGFHFPIDVLDGHSYRLKVVGTNGVTYIWGASLRHQ